ncbi:MAG: hypothetical protein U1F24_07785 [Alphaproteobacteria bacterium]|mgnify:CR=1 FL=1|jgi:hypothetical protein
MAFRIWRAALAASVVAGLCALPAASAARRPPAAPKLHVRIFEAAGAPGQQAEARACAPAGWKIVSGGARVEWTGPGALLTASYPEANCWVARSKDHLAADTHRVIAYAVAIQDPSNQWDVAVDEFTSTYASHPEASFEASRPGYVMTGGGARVNWEADPSHVGQIVTPFGNLLTGSYPDGKHAWAVRAKDHIKVSPASVTVYVISLKARNGAKLTTAIFTGQSQVSGAPAASVSVPAPWTMIGGGARVNWHGVGNLLTASYPDGASSWSGVGKAHLEPSPANLTVYAIGIQAE